MQMNQISLDINKSGQIINEPVVLRVGDKDQTITVNLLKDGQPYTSFTTATFFANKPSGAIVANDPANIKEGVITYTVPQALVNEFGKITNAYFLIDGKVSTESFVIAVLQGVNISDDLNDYIPGMSNLNVIYDKWKNKLQAITDELTGIDAPKEVKNVIDNELKNYTNQVNELQKRITAAETQLNALEVPKIGGRNYLLGTTDNLATSQGVGYSAGIPTYPVNMGCSTDTTFTARAWLHPYSHPMTVQIAWLDASKVWQYGGSDFITAGSSGYSTCTMTIPAGGTLAYVAVVFDTNETDTTQVDYKELKLEKGNVATDWTLNPLDCLSSEDVTKLIKANQPDLSGFQTQAIFQTGQFVLNTCPQSTDFGEFLKSDSVPKGFSIIRDNNTYMNWRIIKEGSKSDYIYGLSQDPGKGNAYHLEVLNGVYKGYQKVISDLIGQTITATDDTGKTVKLKITGIS
ncbi:hypothetical protein [Companilactobacillus halodurans]|uniref:DUF2479 domain-containing protein n=1 Tax=Companilactobacillus halodurans TaxID=2584183 RepID=A0A5P0ZZ15_9LACO|nr:hypothetical protein [Companilactobacillus halodurans]MQS98326.1 hypothetical protein [Companilactobacillus halodurans]